MERIQKILAQGGISSRRAAEQLIKAGRVRVNGHIVSELGAKADARRDRVEVDGKRVVAEDLFYVVLHKPRGVVSTMSDPEGRPTVKDLLGGLGARVYPVGRLDFATSGILLATNDGELADGLLHPRKTVPKTYVLKVKGVMSEDDIAQWSKGIRLEDGMTLPAETQLLRHEVDKTWLELTIREGRNQQIRRMGEATRFPVMRLARVAFAGVSADGLAPGKWRHLTRDELIALKKTYGVPRSIPSGVVAAATREPTKGTQRSIPSARRGNAGRAQRAFGSEERGGAENENWGERSTFASRKAEARGERAPAGRGERAPTGRGERAPAGRGERAPAGRGERAPAGRGERAPAGRGERAPAGRGERAPAGRGERAPAGRGERAPAGRGERAPAGRGERAPAGRGERAPAGRGERAPAGRGERAPAGRGERAPAGRGERAPAGRGERAPAGRGERAPAGRGERAPAGRGERAPAGRGEREGAPPRTKGRYGR